MKRAEWWISEMAKKLYVSLNCGIRRQFPERFGALSPQRDSQRCEHQLLPDNGAPIFSNFLGLQSSAVNS